ncbi:MAG: hydrogenase maturation protease [Nitriliruptoraceae bacterium]
MTTLVLGVGHPDRGDDAAGPLVAEALLGTPGIDARAVTADPSALLGQAGWDTASQVVLIDTVRTGARPGSIHYWSGTELLEHLPATGGGTHDLGVATTLQLAAALDRLPANLTVIGIEGVRFTFGAAPTAAVERAVAVVTGALSRGSWIGID